MAMQVNSIFYIKIAKSTQVIEIDVNEKSTFEPLDVRIECIRLSFQFSQFKSELKFLEHFISRNPIHT